MEVEGLQPPRHPAGVLKVNGGRSRRDKMMHRADDIISQLRLHVAHNRGYSARLILEPSVFAILPRRVYSISMSMRERERVNSGIHRARFSSPFFRRKTIARGNAIDDACRVTWPWRA